MSPTVTVAPMPISTTQLLYESKKAKGQKFVSDHPKLDIHG